MIDTSLNLHLEEERNYFLEKETKMSSLNDKIVLTYSEAIDKIYKLSLSESLSGSFYSLSNTKKREINFEFKGVCNCLHKSIHIL